MERDKREGEMLKRDAEKYRDEERCKVLQRAKDSNQQQLEILNQLANKEHMRRTEQLREEASSTRDSLPLTLCSCSTLSMFLSIFLFMFLA